MERTDANAIIYIVIYRMLKGAAENTVHPKCAFLSPCIQTATAAKQKRKMIIGTDMQRTLAITYKALRITTSGGSRKLNRITWISTGSGNRVHKYKNSDEARTFRIRQLSAPTVAIAGCRAVEKLRQC